MSAPIAKGQKNDFNDAEAIAEAVQRPTMKFVATKTAEQLDLQALHRVRERLVSQRTGIINQIRGFMLERGIAVRHGLCWSRSRTGNVTGSNPGSKPPRGGCTTTYWRSRSPTSLPASPGRCWPKDAPSS